MGTPRWLEVKSVSIADSNDANPRTKRSSRRRSLFIAAYFVFIALLLFVALRVVLMFRANQSIDGSMDEIDVWTFYYPELEHTNALTDANDDTHFDVLFLGGSVLQQVTRKLKPADFVTVAPGGVPIRLYDLTKSAHTTRDSLLKFRQLQHRQFDLIVVYHGINDVRMNCCKGDLFKDDYTHCEWYRSMTRRVAEKRISFSDIVADTASQFIGLGEPEPDLIAEGHDIKTVTAFHSNLSSIVTLARRSRGSTVVIGTFALCLPDEYTREAFEAGELGYHTGDYEMPAESWGEPDAVRKTVAAHNDVVRSLVGEKAVTLFDAESGLSKDITLFCDVCHVSDAGREKLKRLLLRVAGTKN